MKNLTLILTVGLLAGCASSTPHYDARFGDAVRAARQAMTINPNPGTNTDAAMGLDGKAARQASERYHDSFKSPPPVVNVINIGSSPASR